MQSIPGSLATAPRGAARPHDRLMWITPDRLFYVGLLGAPSVRTMGALSVYVAVAGSIGIRLAGGEWQVTRMAVVPPYVPHQVAAEARLIDVIQLEAESVDLDALPRVLRARGAVDAPAFVERVRRRQRELCERGPGFERTLLDFDELFFEGSVARRAIEPRMQTVVDRIKADPAGRASAEECAQWVHLSFSRFLHLFRQEVGAPFRSFRSWKRARSLLHHVNRDANLAHVALDTGYPDSTHFSHSIRQVYGLKPKDIFAGSRRLAVFAHALPAAAP
jgi:AraC-like DNA-binding protein